jgi:CBS domain containing-hemolysin-like protein
LPHTGFQWDLIFLNMVLVLLLVILNGFFVAAEFSLVKVRQSRLQQLENEGNPRAKYALAVSRKLDAYLSATQLGITLASLGLGWVGEKAIAHLVVEPLFEMVHAAPSVVTDTISFLISFSSITFLHIVLGELAPKTYAIQRSETASLWLSAPLIMFYKLFMPAIWVLNGAANRLLRLFGIEQVSEHEAAHTEEEIRILMDESVRSGHIDEDEMELFDNIFEFSDRLAREVMVPRTDMDCVYLETPFSDTIKHVHQTKHTRYPVAKGDKDSIIGFLHITDLLTADPEEVHDLADFMRPILTVPESMEISKVLKMMQKGHSQLAIVIDEYGGTAGLLTAEDMLEVIVGEIHDEFDEHERPFIEVSEELTSVDGRMLIEELNDLLSLDIEEEEVDSIGGWMFMKLEGVPAKGKQVRHGDFVLEVSEVKRLRVLRVSIYRKDEDRGG